MNELFIWVCQENIKRFHVQLTKARSDDQRRIVTALLNKETAALDKYTRVREKMSAPLRAVTRENTASIVSSELTHKKSSKSERDFVKQNRSTQLYSLLSFQVFKKCG